MSNASTIGSRFEKYTGQETEVYLPDIHEGLPLTQIGNKAFLSCKSVEALYLPSSVEQIEDWAFAHMKNLNSLTLAAIDITFGKKVFLGCDSLTDIYLSNVDKTLPGLSKFLAVAFLSFPLPELTFLSQLQTTEGQINWLHIFDPQLIRYILQPDDVDFVPAFIGWFDVEDLDDQKDAFMTGVRLQKIKLSFQRLHYPDFLSSENKQILESYLRKHLDFIIQSILKGILLEAELISFLKILEQCAGLNAAHCQTLLSQKENADAEVKAFLIEKQLSQKKENFFEDLEL